MGADYLQNIIMAQLLLIVISLSRAWGRYGRKLYKIYAQNQAGIYETSTMQRGDSYRTLCNIYDCIKKQELEFHWDCGGWRRGVVLGRKGHGRAHAA